MRIGAVAAAAGVSVDAVRFYERRGLLPRAPRSEGGYRMYGEGAVARVRGIRRLQTLGLSLGEIRTLGAAGDPGCGDVRGGLEKQRRQVRERIRELQALEAELGRALRNCDRNLRRSGGRNCPALDSGARSRV